MATPAPTSSSIIRLDPAVAAGDNVISLGGEDGLGGDARADYLWLPYGWNEGREGNDIMVGGCQIGRQTMMCSCPSRPSTIRVIGSLDIARARIGSR